MSRLKTIVVNQTNALVSWVDKALNRNNVKNTLWTCLKLHESWPLNPNAMDHNTRPNDAYIIAPINILDENNDIPNGTIDESWQWVEDGPIIQLMKITFLHLLQL